MMYAIYMGSEFHQSVEGEMAAVITGSMLLVDHPNKCVSILEVISGDAVIDLLRRDDDVFFERHKDYSGT